MTEEKSIPWREVVERAKARGHFADDEKFRGRVWNTCAVGEKLGAELDKWPFRVDPKLEALGYQFTVAVFDNDIARVEELLAAIEAFPVA